MSYRAIFSWVILAGLAVAAGVAFFLWGPARQRKIPPVAAVPTRAEAPPIDPRLAFDTPFRNVRPDVAFVGDAACAACHKELCDSFHQHPMGRSAAMWSAAERVEQFGPEAHSTFEGPTGGRYRVEERDGRLWQTEEVLGADGSVVAEVAAEATVVIGSGRQARSYLCVRDGSLWQTGVSWFTSSQRWDPSPGFHPGEHAQRPVLETCLFCHVDRVQLVPGSEMRYQEPLFARQAQIGCERCHGPGALHVEERTDERPVKGKDTSIVNPRHLAPDLRDAVCQQCHLQGIHQVARRGRSVFDYRPGLPLELVQSVFVMVTSGADDLTFVGHVEQMAASRCATASGGKLSCTSCHDPHRDPPEAERVLHFRNACLACHANRGCSLPAAERQVNGDACANCHMPRRPTLDITHTAITDHRITRRTIARGAPTSRVPSELPIKLFHAGSRFAPPAEEQERDLGVALAYLVRVGRAQGRLDPALASAALDRLRRATGQFPSDAAAWESLAVVLAAENQPVEALAAAERALSIELREASLHQAAQLALELNQVEKARKFTRQAVELNPGNSLSRLLAGMALVEARQWNAAAADLRAGLAEMPLNNRARTALAVCLLHQGDAAGAQAELDRAAATSPEQARSLRQWYNRRAK